MVLKETLDKDVGRTDKIKKKLLTILLCFLKTNPAS